MSQNEWIWYLNMISTLNWRWQRLTDFPLFMGPRSRRGLMGSSFKWRMTMSYSSMRLKNFFRTSGSTFFFENSGHSSGMYGWVAAAGGAIGSSSFTIGGMCATAGLMLENSLREIDCSLEYKLYREGCPQSSAELRRPKSGATTGVMVRGRAAALQRGTTHCMILRNLKQGEEAR